jgi:hypothetical protein
MHKSGNKKADGWKISRWNFFLLVWLGAFAWYFLPGLLMPALSYFNVITWFAPENVVVANLVSDHVIHGPTNTDDQVRGFIRLRPVSHDPRLGSNCLYRFTSGDTLVGGRQRRRRAGDCDVDHRSDSVYDCWLLIT